MSTFNDQQENFWSESEEIMGEDQAKAVLSGSAIPSFQEPMVSNVAEEPSYSLQTEEDEEDPNTVRQIMSDARLRLEQGRLYEMLLEHSLFGDVQANPQAIKNVEREIRRFIRERLEILLGLKEDPRLAREVQVASQFTPFEVDFLKKLISKTTGGISQQVHAPPPESAVTGSIRKISNQVAQPSPPARKPSPVSARPSSVRVAPPKKARPQVPAQPAITVKTKQGIVEIPEEIEAPLERPVSQMQRSELAERNQRIAERQANKKAQIPTDRLPTPTPDQAQAMVVASVMGRMQNGKMANGMMLAPLINKIVSNKNEGESE